MDIEGRSRDLGGRHPAILTLWERLRAPSAAALLVYLAACSPSAMAPVRELPAEASAFLVKAPEVYAAPDAMSMTSESAHLRATFEGALAPQDRALLRHEPALDLVASVIAQTYSVEQQPPTKALTQWLFWKCGATSLFSHARPSWAFGKSGTQETLDEYASRAAQGTKPLFPTTYGVARFTQGTKTSQAIVFGRASLDVSTLQKSYAPGGPLTIQTRPLDASTEFTFFIDAGDGSVIREPMQKREDGTLFISRALPSRPGRYFIEIRARGPQALAADPNNPWERTLLLVPIYVGVPEPMIADEPIRALPLSPADPSAWPAWIAAQYNAERAKHGNPALTLAPPLVAMAQGRSAELAAVDFEVPLEPQLRQKFAAAGFTKERHDESYGTLESASDFVYMEMLRPSTRLRLALSKQLSLGIGVAARPVKPNGRQSYTEVEYAAYQ